MRRNGPKASAVLWVLSSFRSVQRRVGDADGRVQAKTRSLAEEQGVHVAKTTRKKSPAAGKSSGRKSLAAPARPRALNGRPKSSAGAGTTTAKASTGTKSRAAK